MTQRTVSSSDDNKEDVRRCDIKEEMEIALFHIYNLVFELNLRLDSKPYFVFWLVYKSLLLLTCFSHLFRT